MLVNGIDLPRIESLLDSIEWEELYKGIQSNFHGDLQFDNVLKTYTQSRLEFTLGKKFAEDLAHYKIRLYNCKRVQEICKEGLTKIKKLLIKLKENI